MRATIGQRKVIRSRRCIVAILFLLISSVAFAQSRAAHGVEISLAPDKPRYDPENPYRPATLTIDNSGEASFHTVKLDPVGGGPTMVYSVPIGPRLKQEYPVRIAALSLEQVVGVTLIGQDVSQTQHADISWPLEWVSRKAFIRPEMYRGFPSGLPAWSGSVRQKLFATSALLALLCISVLFLRNALAKRATLLVLASVAVIGFGFFAQREPVVRIRDWTRNGNTLQAVYALRTTTWKPDAQAQVVPVYPSRAAAKREDMQIHAASGAVVPLSPDQPRLFDELSNAVKASR